MLLARFGLNPVGIGIYMSSSRMLASESRTTSKNASFTFRSSFAEVSKWGILPLCLQYSSTSLRSTHRSDFLAHLEITLAADDNEREAVCIHDATLADEFPLPVFDVREALLLRDVVDQDACIRASIESSADGLELLLAGSIPDLENDLLIVVCDFVGKEIGADRNSVLIRELSLHISHDQRCLSDSA